MKLSTKPYLLRALYEWCLDSEQTPHLVAWVNENTTVPMQYVKDDQIVLNISPTACNRFTIDNEWVNFSARFSGVVNDIWVPVGHVMGIYARETGDGMGFEVEPYESINQKQKPNLQIVLEGEDSDKSDEEDTKSQEVSKPKKGLKLVK